MSERKLEFTPSTDEASRHGFVAALKGYANMVVQSELEKQIETKVIQEREAPENLTRDDIEEDCKNLPLYAFWGNLTYHSQDMLFTTVKETVDRTRAVQEAIAQELTKNPGKLGRLELDPMLVITNPISTTEIHRQPGGYTAEDNGSDLTAGRVYSGTIELYRNAKAMGDGSQAGSDAIGQFTASTVKKYFPELSPKTVLDMGCGTGEQTVAFKRAFPDAQVHGLDTAGPLLRYAHAWAENEGLEIHYKQANAQETGYEDGSFDLIVSHILFHETSHDIMPKIMEEAKRLLAPGGVFLNLDVPYQPDVTPLPRQVTNNWQVINNGEPFWTGFSESNLVDLLSKAGFEGENTIHNYETFGKGKYLVFGASK